LRPVALRTELFSSAPKNVFPKNSKLISLPSQKGRIGSSVG
jgi:hypothetical protein